MKHSPSKPWCALIFIAAMAGCSSSTGPGPGNDGGQSCPSTAPPLGTNAACSNWPSQCIFACETCQCDTNGMTHCQYTCGGPDNDAGPDVQVNDAGPVACPTAPPADGTTCSQRDQQCSYGDDPDTQCRLVATCTDSRWIVFAPADCPADTGRPACPASAPASMSACTSRDQLCAFADGTRCTCAACPPGGVPCMGSTLQWYCDAPLPAPCPASVPNIGAACSPEGADCNYSPCAGTGWDVHCTNGVWVREQIACGA